VHDLHVRVRPLIVLQWLQGMKWSIRSLRTFMTTRHGAEAANELFHNIQVRAEQCSHLRNAHCSLHV
jgi:hypothetical protein